MFQLQAKLRGLRGSAFDIFGHTDPRRLERELIAGCEKDVAHMLSVLSPPPISPIRRRPDRGGVNRSAAGEQAKSASPATGRRHAFAKLRGVVANLTRRGLFTCDLPLCPRRIYRTIARPTVCMRQYIFPC